MKPTASSRKPLVAQIDAFKAAARELECDESEEAFQRNLRAVAKALSRRSLPNVRAGG